MSRVGKKPVAVPKGVTAKVEGRIVSMKGPKGELSFTTPDEVSVVLESNEIRVEPRGETKRARAMWGTARARIEQLAVGVTAGFSKNLEITGVGYKAAVVGKNLQLSLGYSHDVNFQIPAGVLIATPQPTRIQISGSDAQLVGEIAAKIRKMRPPEPYKGKGVKYENEFIFRKEGKKK